MKYALNHKEDGRILSATFERFAAQGAVIVDALPEGDISEYRYVNGEFVYDPVPAPDTEEVEPTTEEILLEIAADHEARLCEIELGVN